MAPLSFAPPAATSVEEAYKPAFEEIARRKAAAEAQADGVTYFARTDGAAHLPAAPPQQTWVLASMGTAVLAPVPADPARPALRVYGAFATKQDAAEHADVVRQLDPRCSLLLLERGAWALMPRTAATRDDPAENARRREAVLARHRGEQARDAAEFERVVKERADRPAPRPPPAEDDPDVADAEAAVYGAPRRLRAGGEVRGQAAMALSVVPDAGGECLVAVHGCFETAAEADAWVRNVATRAVVDDDVFVVPTCEWCYPNAARQEEGAAHYRADELQRIMDAAAQHPQKVREYKEWKAEQDRLEAEERAAKAAAAVTEAAGPEAGEEAAMDTSE